MAGEIREILPPDTALAWLAIRELRPAWDDEDAWVRQVDDVLRPGGYRLAGRVRGRDAARGGGGRASGPGRTFPGAGSSTSTICRRCPPRADAGTRGAAPRPGSTGRPRGSAAASCTSTPASSSSAATRTASTSAAATRSPRTTSRGRSAAPERVALAGVDPAVVVAVLAAVARRRRGRCRGGAGSCGCAGRRRRGSGVALVPRTTPGGSGDPARHAELEPVGEPVAVAVAAARARVRAEHLAAVAEPVVVAVAVER